MRFDWIPAPTARNVLSGLVGVSAFGVVTASLVGAAGGWFWLFDLFSHYRLQYAALLGLLLVAAAALRAPLVAGVVALAFVVHLIPLASLVWGPDQPAGTGQALRLVQFNAQIGNPDVAGAADWLLSQDADLIVVQEVDQRWADVLDRELTGMRRLDAGVATVRTDSFGMVVYVADDNDRIDVTLVDVVNIASIPAYLIEIDVGRPEVDSLLVVALHTLPPLGRADVEQAGRQFEWASDVLAGHEGPRVLIGDLNATRWSAPFRVLTAHTGLRDSAEGFGLRGTWPSQLAFTGMIGIDHVLVSDQIRVDDRKVGPDLGSDHRPVVADLTIISG